VVESWGMSPQQRVVVQFKWHHQREAFYPAGSAPLRLVKRGATMLSAQIPVKPANPTAPRAGAQEVLRRLYGSPPPVIPPSSTRTPSHTPLVGPSTAPPAPSPSIPQAPSLPSPPGVSSQSAANRPADEQGIRLRLMKWLGFRR
jgi:hypothetical protein